MLKKPSVVIWLIYFTEILIIIKNSIIDLPRPRKRLIQLLYDASLKTEVQDKLFNILFLRTPLSILGTNKIERIELAANYLKGANILL